MTNLLRALKNIAENPGNDLKEIYSSTNRINNTGGALEYYIKDAFCGSFAEKNIAKKDKAHSEHFSYLGNSKNPPDIIIKGGDAIEVKKHEKATFGSLALNSSYPKDFLHADSPMISKECRECEAETWNKKDILYAAGSILEKKIRSLWFVYGTCYAADREVYEKIKNMIADEISSLPDIEPFETNELGRVNKVDPLGITDLRIRGMWAIKHPAKVFDYLPESFPAATFKVSALMLSSKYAAFPLEDRLALEAMASKNFLFQDVEVKSPNNPAKYLSAKLITFHKE